MYALEEKRCGFDSDDELFFFQYKNSPKEYRPIVCLLMFCRVSCHIEKLIFYGVFNVVAFNYSTTPAIFTFTSLDFAYFAVFQFNFSQIFGRELIWCQFKGIISFKLHSRSHKVLRL